MPRDSPASPWRLLCVLFVWNRSLSAQTAGTIALKCADCTYDNLDSLHRQLLSEPDGRGLPQIIRLKLDVRSAGTSPAQRVHPLAVEVMSEVGIDLSAHTPKLVGQFLTESFDNVITVCNHANETCPLFTGKVRHRLHIAFDDPAEVTGTPEEVIGVFRRVGDEIRRDFHRLYIETLLYELNRRES